MPSDNFRISIGLVWKSLNLRMQLTAQCARCLCLWQGLGSLKPGENIARCQEMFIRVQALFSLQVECHRWVLIQTREAMWIAVGNIAIAAQGLLQVVATFVRKVCDVI